MAGGNFGSAPYGGAHGKAAILYLHLYRPIRAIQMQVEDSGFMGGARGVDIVCRWVGDSGAYRGDGWESVGSTASVASRKE